MKPQLTFGIQGTDLQPRDITDAFGITPSHSFAKGDRHVIRGNERIRPHGVWQLRSDAFTQSTDLVNHAETLIYKLRPLKSQIEPILKDSRYYVSIRIWIEADESVISLNCPADTFKELASYCNSIDFSIVLTHAQNEPS